MWKPKGLIRLQAGGEAKRNPCKEPQQGNFLQREKPEGLIRIQAGGGAKRNPCKQIETENKPLKG